MCIRSVQVVDKENSYVKLNVCVMQICMNKYEIKTVECCSPKRQKIISISVSSQHLRPHFYSQI